MHSVGQWIVAKLHAALTSCAPAPIRFQHLAAVRQCERAATGARCWVSLTTTRASGCTTTKEPS